SGNNNQPSTSTDDTVTFDTTVPTATSSPSGVTTSGGDNYQFTVTYSDNVAINVSSLDGSDIRVTGPAGFNTNVFFLGVDISSNGTPRVATYSFSPPDGFWDSSDNGAYS